MNADQKLTILSALLFVAIANTIGLVVKIVFKINQDYLPYLSTGALGIIIVILWVIRRHYSQKE